MKSPIRVAVTALAGAIGYSILLSHRVRRSLCADQPIILNLVDIEQSHARHGRRRHGLQDCASPVSKD